MLHIGIDPYWSTSRPNISRTVAFFEVLSAYSYRLGKIARSKIYLSRKFGVHTSSRSPFMAVSVELIDFLAIFAIFSKTARHQILLNFFKCPFECYYITINTFPWSWVVLEKSQIIFFAFFAIFETLARHNSR